MTENNVFTEGYLKFNCILEHSAPSGADIPNELFICRKRLKELQLIGQFPNGIGYGNISIRRPDGCFYITGTRTGGIPMLDENHIVLVRKWDVNSNTVWGDGNLNASSETLTHAALYDHKPGVEGVIHIHHNRTWRKLMAQPEPHTPESIPYGTTEMAEAVGLLAENQNGNSGYFAMGGHEDGIIAYGKTLTEAADLVSELYCRWGN